MDAWFEAASDIDVANDDGGRGVEQAGDGGVVYKHCHQETVLEKRTIRLQKRVGRILSSHNLLYMRVVIKIKYKIL